VWFFARRKIGELKERWDDMPVEEKNRWIALVIDNLVRSVDHITGVDIAESLAMKAERVVERRRIGAPQSPEQTSGWRKRRDRRDSDEDDY